MDQKPATSLMLAEPGYKTTVLYWVIAGIVTVIFLASTFAYWRGTLRVIDENTVTGIEVRRPLNVTPALEL